jgi:hypothetical protein
MRAVDISTADRARVYRAIRGRLLARPRDFIWPPRDVAAGGVASEAGTQGGRS